MTTILSNQVIHTGLASKLMEPLAKGLSEFRKNMKAQHAAWQRYNQTACVRHIPRRAWMRHGAMLEQISRRST